MGIVLTATFDTRREADLTVERLVQEFDLDRTAILVATDGDENSVGEDPSGSDLPSVRPDEDGRDDGALNGGIVVSVEARDEAEAQSVMNAFAEFNAAGVVGSGDTAPAV